MRISINRQHIVKITPSICKRGFTLRAANRSEERVLDQGFHRVSSLHRVYYEVHGNPNGPAAVVLHGGPGAGCSAAQGKLFDLDFWKVVLFDQRGCGKSVPTGLLDSNNPKKIIGDIEKLRHHLEISQWMVFGGSYGTTLALAYAQLHTSRVSGMVLRAICLMRKKELDWLFAPNGAALLFPKAWQRFLSILQPNEQREPIKAYYNRMLSLKDPVRIQAARYWREWTMMVEFSNLPQAQYQHINTKAESLFSTAVNLTRNLNLYNNRSVHNVIEEVSPLPKPIIQSLIEAHFFYNNEKFITKPFPILDRVNRLKDISCIAIHGEEDPLCSKDNALDLKRSWKELDLRLIPKGRHSQFNPSIREATVLAIEQMKTRIQNDQLEQDEFHDQSPSPTYPIPEPHYRKKYR